MLKRILFVLAALFCTGVAMGDTGTLHREAAKVARLGRTVGINLVTTLEPPTDAIPCPGPEIFPPNWVTGDERYPQVLVCYGFAWIIYELCCEGCTTSACRADCRIEYENNIIQCTPVPDTTN